MTKRDISGVLLLDKPYGITSNKALQKVKHLYTPSKCGHTGTLDPMATGMLPICIGEATKFTSVLLNASKTYEAVIRLGYRSTTGDAEGEITKLPESSAVPLDIQYCETVLQQFIGETSQTPPMHSALKHHGKPLYFYARQGVAIERESRTINIDAIQIESLSANELTVIISCGTGTYIRVLAEDIGKALGWGGAYLISLRRHSVGNFSLPQTQALKELEVMDSDQRDDCLMPIDSIMQELPYVSLSQLETQAILHGRVLEKVADLDRITDQAVSAKNIRLYYQHLFLGLGEISSCFTIKPKRLLSNTYLNSQSDFSLN